MENSGDALIRGRLNRELHPYYLLMLPLTGLPKTRLNVEFPIVNQIRSTWHSCWVLQTTRMLSCWQTFFFLVFCGMCNMCFYRLESGNIFHK